MQNKIQINTNEVNNKTNKNVVKTQITIHKQNRESINNKKVTINLNRADLSDIGIADAKPGRCKYK